MMVDKEFLEKVLVVVVLYEKEPVESKAIQRLAPLSNQGLQILVFDNSSQPCRDADEAYLYHHSKANVGVSGAYNFAAHQAKELHKKWLWLLDDDTELNPDFLVEVQNILDKKNPPRLVVPRIFSGGQLLSPFSFINSTPKRLKEITPGKWSLNNYRPINSGMFIKLATFHQAGGYSTKLPLDFADIEFTDRLAEICPEMLVAKTHFKHSFSGDEKPTKQKAQARYELFLQAANVYFGIATNPSSVKKQALKRAFRLSAAYFSGTFIWRYYKTVFTK